MPSVHLAQLPVPPTHDVQAADGGLWSTVIAVVVVVGFLLLMAVALRKVLTRGKAPLPKPPPAEKPGALPPPEPKPPLTVALPPTEAEAQRRAEADQERQRAEALRAEREKLQREAGTDAAKAEAARKLKDEEEEAKRAAYRAEKAAEAEEKERKKREKDEAARLEAEAAERARLEAEQKKKEAEEAQRRRVEAEAGHTLAFGLTKTRTEGFMAKLNGLFGAPRAIDDKALGELEEVLFTADIGVKTASRLVELARGKVKAKELDSVEKIKGVIRKEVEGIVDLRASHALSGGGPPHVIMVVGVNGAGKTTTIGKLAAKATAEKKKVVLAAGDTFRAAAAEQLDVWAERAGAQLVKGKEEADPSSVIFDAIKLAKEQGADLVIADTAGRLHTKANLMEELKKVKRVIDKALPGAPHEVLLVLDSTNGQNAIAQAKQFHESVGVTSIALTKLDGTAKGGVIIGICDELKVPVSWAGVGEKVADLRPFEPKEFVEALFA
jgi:fused signal recognition particle receptor